MRRSRPKLPCGDADSRRENAPRAPRGTRSRFLVCSLRASLLLLLAARVAHAGEWRSTFAAIGDTTVFLLEDGTLVRAPFHMATSETLWTPARGQHVVRLAASADGARCAWLTRGQDGDTTRLWIVGRDGTRAATRFFAAQPRELGVTYSEPDLPGIEDKTGRGGRLRQPGAHTRRSSLNAVAWLADPQTLAFGFDGGIAALHVGRGGARPTVRLRAIAIEALLPSPMLLVDGLASAGELASDAVTLHARELTALEVADSPSQFELDHLPHWQGEREGVVRGTFLVCPAVDRWRLFTLPHRPEKLVWAASHDALWWAEGATIRGVRADRAEIASTLNADERILWLGCDEPGKRLLWATRTGLYGRAWEHAGDVARWLAPAAPVEQVLRARTSPWIGVLTRDSVYACEPATGEVRRFRSSGLELRALYTGPARETLFALRPAIGGGPQLVRGDPATASLVETHAPVVRDGVFQPVAGGAWILLYNPGERPPHTIHAYDARARAWSEVENPGISAWEPLGARAPDPPPGK